MSPEPKMFEKIPEKATWAISLLLSLVLFLLSGLLVPACDSEPWRIWLLRSVPYTVLIASILLFSAKALSTPPSKLLAPSGVFRFSRMLLYCLIWMLCLAAVSAARALLSPQSFTRAENWRFFCPMLFSALWFTAIQTFSEELVFRVGLFRVMADEMPAEPGRQIVLSLCSGLVFAAFHIGTIDGLARDGGTLPAIKAAVFYLALGMLLMWLSLRQGGFEAAIGIHFGNNLFLDLVLDNSGSTLMKNPAFLYHGAVTDAILIEFAFCALVCIIVSTIIGGGHRGDKEHQNNGQD